MTNFCLLTLALLSWVPAFLCEVTTEKELVVLEGRSLTVPCHYEPQFASYAKYWCQGSTREFCTSLAETDDLRSADPAEDKVSISDDPVQQVFTVTMRDLKEADTGWYMCGVKIGGAWSADVHAFTYVKVIHGMSIVNRRVSGEEGSSVTVECLYSEKYRQSEKKWCRSGDWNSCRQTGSERSYEDASVAISDDRTGAFTVTLKRVQMKDTGWFWCSAGQEKLLVQVIVTPRTSTTAASAASSATASQSAEHLPPQKSITNCWSLRSPVWVSMAVASTLVLLLCVAVVVKKLWRPQKQDLSLRTANGMTSSYKPYSDDAGTMEEAGNFIFRKNSPDVCLY